MSDQKNLILAIIASVVIMLGFQYFYEWPRAEQARKLAEMQRQEQQQATPVPVPGGAPAPGAAPSATMPGAAPAIPNREAVLTNAPRVKISSARLHGSINLQGGRLDDLTLAEYREKLEANSPEIVLLAPAGTANPYYSDFGWSAASDAGIKLPGPDTVWTASAATLAPGQPVTLTWDNGDGLKFSRTFALDDKFMFTVTQKVENSGDKAATVFPYALISRHGTPLTDGLYILHEGPLGVFRDKAEQDGTLKETSYSDLKGKPATEVNSIGGWIGITDKYWLTALIPGNDTAIKARFSHTARGTQDRYQIDVLANEGATVAPKGSTESTVRLFAGAKLVNLIDAYEKQYGIPRFDRAIDWGWFYFLTKPIFFALDYFYKMIGNFGLAILALTVIIKTLFLPLAYRSYVSMSQMKELQPKMVELREKFGEDRTKLNQEMMALYKREKINPAAGCLPILLQIPVFFALYKVLYITIEMRHAPFYGWINDLSAPDPTTYLNLFGLLPYTVPNLGPLQILSLGAWPILMGISMWLQMKMNPQPPDPIQAKVFAFMPFIFTFMLGSFASGLVIYWTWNNLLSVAQQWFIMRRVKHRKLAATPKKA